METQAELKTEPLPYTLLVKGKFWYFRTRHSGTIRLRGTYGDPSFMRHYERLLDEHGRTLKAKRADNREVYFIAWEGGPIKIGISGSNGDRITTLQNACPYKLHILATAKGGRVMELAYHKRFAKHRLRGEWFERTPELLAEIDRLNMTSRESV